jgi:transcriptional regulator with XRE-family HTH domain
LAEFEDVGKLLQAVRRKLGLTQEQFASSLGIKLSRLQKWETGVNGPRFTISELRGLREINWEIYEAIVSGFLLLQPPPLAGRPSPWPQSDPAE